MPDSGACGCQYVLERVAEEDLGLRGLLSFSRLVFVGIIILNGLRPSVSLYLLLSSTRNEL